MEIKLKVNIGKISKWFDNWKPERGDDAQRDGCEVMHLCIDGAMFVLIMKLLTCCNYSYVLSTINCLSLDTVVTLFLFIYRSVPIFYLFATVYLFFIYLPQCTYFLFIYLSVPIFYLFTAAYLFLFIHCSVWDSISESLDYLLGTEQLSALNRKTGEQKDRGTERYENRKIGER